MTLSLGFAEDLLLLFIERAKMSQDMFGSDPDEPDLSAERICTPQEFSGVSGSSSSTGRLSRPLTQQDPPPEPEQPPLEATAPSSLAPKVYKCPTCKRKKTFKTLKGFKKHMIDYHKVTITDDDSENYILQAAPAPRASSSKPTQIFICPECEKKIETKQGFLGHRVSHRIKEANKRKPTASQLKEESLIPIMEKVVKEILAEPSYDDSKAKILHEFNNKKESPEWLAFVHDLGDIICSFVCDEKQKKLLPMNQYEVAQTKLNAYLNSQNVQLREKFLAICINANNFHINRLIFRIATKMLSNIQIWVVKKMSLSTEQALDRNIMSMSELEEKNFACDLGHFFRKRFKRYRGVKDVYSDCIKETFVDGEHPISKFDFLNEKNWFSGEEKCIVPSYRAFQFFKSIEVCIRSSKEITNAEDVIEIIFERSYLLDHWFYLTNSYISEQDSLVFMRDLAHHYLKISLLSEEKRRNREEEQAIQANAAALRTHLHHNFAEKDDCEESVE